jgi:hypothetical protein
VGLTVDHLWRLPQFKFQGTWIAFKEDLPEPEHYGAKGREKIEIVLLLAITHNVPVLAENSEWLALDHQCGGVCCFHRRMLAHRLIPNPSVYPKLRQLARDRWPNDPGDRIDRFYRDLFLQQVEAYRRDLGHLGLDCANTYGHLTESLYPMDARQEYLDRIAINTPSLADLLPGYDPTTDPTGLAIFVLTDNSD